MAVYFILNEETGLIKIGHSSNAVKRLKMLQTGSHSRLRIVRLVEGHQKDEKALHKRFAHKKKLGEWFQLSDADTQNGFGLIDLKIPEPQKIIGKTGRHPIGEKPMTTAERQARRREQFRRMREALEAIREVRTAKVAREIASNALEYVKGESNAD